MQVRSVPWSPQECSGARQTRDRDRARRGIPARFQSWQCDRFASARPSRAPSRRQAVRGSIRDLRPLLPGTATNHVDAVKGWFAHHDAERLSVLDDELPSLPHVVADRACCCPARPVVTVMMPPTPHRPYAVDLLLCGHHFRVSRAALEAAGAAVYDDTGALILGGASRRPPAPLERAAA